MHKIYVAIIFVTTTLRPHPDSCRISGRELDKGTKNEKRKETKTKSRWRQGDSHQNCLVPYMVVAQTFALTKLSIDSSPLWFDIYTKGKPCNTGKLAKREYQ